MTCIHGLDEVNCPTCRFTRATIPLNPINKIELNKNYFILKNPLFEKNHQHDANKDNEIVFNNIPTPSLITQLPKLNLLGEIPDFTNQLFKDRIRDLNLDKSNPTTKTVLDNHDLLNDEN